MLKNTKNSYGLVTKILHWIVGLLIISMLIVGFSMSSMSPSPEKFELYKMHKAFGVTTLSLVVIRILWRITNINVQAAAGVSTILQWSAQIGHLLLYILMLIMPISGLLMTRFYGYSISVFDIFTIPAASEKNAELAKLFHSIHEYAASGLVILITIHVLAALYHHFILKDNTLTRIIK